MRSTSLFLSCLAVLGSFVFASATWASQIEYFEDPIFEPLSAEQEHPLHEMSVLAEEGDERALFIMGDLYAKGKGGFGKDIDKAYRFFEKSAQMGNKQSLVRLAAIAKKRGDMVQAYTWYTLAMDAFPQRRYKETFFYILKARNKMAEEKEMAKLDIKEAKRMARNWQRRTAHERRTATPNGENG